MRILVTGDKGFIGKKITEKLNSNGYNAAGYDLSDGYDILDSEKLIKFSEDCNIFIHLAAIETNDPVKVMGTNLQGTWNVRFS